MPWDMAWASAEVRRASEWIQRWGWASRHGHGWAWCDLSGSPEDAEPILRRQGTRNRCHHLVRPVRAVARIWITGVRVVSCCPKVACSVGSRGLHHSKAGAAESVLGGAEKEPGGYIAFIWYKG